MARSVLPRLANPSRFQRDGSADASGSETSIRRSLVSCRCCEVLDDRIAGMPLLGGVQLASREPQLVDNADEGA